MRATSKAVKKYTFRCHGGPYADRDLKLTTANTLPFSCKGMKGRYHGAHLVGIAYELCDIGRATDLLWEELK